MLSPTQTKVLVAVILAVSVAVTIVRGQPVPLHLLTSFSYVVTPISIGLLLWDRWLWAWPIFRPWLSSRPDIRGTWKGQLVSSWPAPGREPAAAPIEAYLVVRQTYSSIDARVFSLEMGSASLSASIVSDPVGLHTLFVIYRSEPKVLLRPKSPTHYGGMLLGIRGDPATKLDGEYWTDRDTKGSVEFLARVKETSYEFNDAAAYFNQAATGPPTEKSDRAKQRRR